MSEAGQLYLTLSLLLSKFQLRVCLFAQLFITQSLKTFCFLANTASGRTVIVSGSNFLTTSGSHTTVSSGASGSITSGTVQSTKNSLSTTASAAALTSSPTRPSILRKRTSDMANGANSSPNAKRLAYESVTLAKRANEKDALTSDLDVSSLFFCIYIFIWM